MKTIMMREQRLQVEEAPRPEPGPGQVLVRSLACGICGSDLHIVRHSKDIFDFYREIGLVPADTGTDSLEVSLGHEFCAEVVAYGPETEQRIPAGGRVTAVPMLVTEHGMVGVGATPGIYGAYSEYFLLDEALLLSVPDDLPNEAAALVEPLAVGLHAVNTGAPSSDEVALVAGCGPIGLSCISALKQRGVETIIASDPSPRARALAKLFGATHPVDPTADDEMQLAAALAGGNRVVVLECVGIPRMIPDFIVRAPEHACIVFTGVHTAPVSVQPAHAMVKQLNLKFSYYYTPEEYAQCLATIASGVVPWEHMITGTVGMSGIPGAFEQLLAPNEHVKVILEPGSDHELRTYQ